ncbi:MAG: TonB-dependent receptor, partial [Nitrosomonas sp.]|uniref:STN domain-containing protein n=1 Tax=Nitrosomonas sp. TaxID=42353 RepID=UPI0025FE55AE
MPKPSVAQSVNTSAAVRTYDISAGYLHDALTQFSQQAGIKLALDPALLEGKVTHGLTGDFEIKAALDQLLAGSGLQVTQRDDGFAIVAVPSASPEPAVTTLPAIQVTASNTNRYAAVSTSTATKTNTLLRDVPQAISVITNEFIRDQSI